MTATSESPTTIAGQERAPTALRSFGAVLRRDLYVTTRELPTFAAQVILQPFFLLFVFGRVLSELGYTRPGYAQLLFPGIVGLTAVVTGLQSTAFPLVIDFSFTKEIEDRLLAPLRTELVAIEKIIYASLRAVVACTIMIPVGIIVLGSIPWRWSAAPLFVAVVVLGALVGSTLGMVMGTLVPPNRINIMFALALTPILFTGASQYPWPSLDKLPWFQVVTAFNPLTYVSEGLRAALVPQVPHINPWICVSVLCLAVTVFGWIGMRGFRRRAID